ncbi:hypothetical protein [Streptomyces caeruleatus]|uniref:Uncharacterized protein n=1 Tax=Streptomyces caeruleatus TaxID=661399 RepID=A0A101U7A8_9ACTN|nr:hypothetical protein [Streptomyces caeruleatus]KUO05394.1 hypothetical protein AQJ67_08525 [Streptomyces caeruleatus]
MLSEALTALAAAGGAGVVQAATTDAWAAFRQRIARLLGRGDEQRESVELERLDRTVVALQSADASERQAARVRHEAAWQTRFELLLESLDDREQEAVATALRSVLAQYGAPSLRTGSSWSGDVTVSAEAAGNARIYQVGQGGMTVHER